MMRPARKTVAFKDAEDEVSFVPTSRDGCGSCLTREREKFEALTLARGTQRLLLRNQEAYFRLEETCRDVQRRQRESTTQVLQQNSRLIAEKAELEKKLAQADIELAELRQMRSQLEWMKANWPAGPHHLEELEGRNGPAIDIKEAQEQTTSLARKKLDLQSQKKKKKTTTTSTTRRFAADKVRLTFDFAENTDPLPHDGGAEENRKPPQTPTLEISSKPPLLPWTPDRDLLNSSSELLSPFPETPPPVLVSVPSSPRAEIPPVIEEPFSARPSRRATLNQCYREPSGKVKLRQGSAPGFKLV